MDQTSMPSPSNPVPLQQDVSANEPVAVFPGLVFKEFLAALLISIGLLIWSLAVNAPLLPEANAGKTENPAKAPWYFVGLQELLVYFDPWIAGVMLPGIILFGLAAIPYLDPNRQGTGAFAPRKRSLAMSIFAFGAALWFALIFIGVLCRGPSWAWYWPWESWEVHKPLGGLAVSLKPALGIPLFVGYLVAGMVLPRFVSRAFRSLDPVRYVVTAGLLTGMAFVPLKIVLRLVFNVKYVVVTPWFNV